MIEFTGRDAPTHQGLVFENEEGSQAWVPVLDKYPEMGDTHIEGRRVVEVSVELFVDLMGAMGYRTVDPESVTTGPGKKDDND